MRTLSRRVVLIVFLGLPLLVWAYRHFHPPSPGVSPPPELHASKGERFVERARVTLLAPLSGPFRRDGEMLRRGAELAWKEIEGEGLQASLVVVDGGGEASETIRRAKKLAVDPEVILVIGHLPVSTLAQIIPVYEREQLPLVIPANSHHSLLDHRWVFPLITCDRMEGAFAAGAVRKWGEDQTVGVIFSPDPYGMLLFEGFREEAMKHRLNFEAVAHSDKDPSGRALLLEMANQDFSAVWLAGPPLWGSEIVGTLKEQGFKGHLLVPRSYGETFLEDLFGRFASQLHIVWPVSVMDPHNKMMQEFREKFRELYWREPNWLAVLGYDAVKWAGQVLQETPFSREKTAAHFLKHDSEENAYQSLAGPVFFDEQGYPRHLSHVTVYDKGRFLPAFPSP